MRVKFFRSIVAFSALELSRECWTAADRVKRCCAREEDSFLENAPPLTCTSSRADRHRRKLAGIECEREFADLGLPGPARGEVNPDAARGLADARADFE